MDKFKKRDDMKEHLIRFSERAQPNPAHRKSSLKQCTITELTSLSRLNREIHTLDLK